MCDKAEITNLLNYFSNTRYDNTRWLRKCIFKIVQFATRMRELNIPIIEDFVFCQVLKSLLIVLHIALRDKCNIVEFISICIQEEERTSRKRVEKLIYNSTVERER